jgi:hypothetical protein
VKQLYCVGVSELYSILNLVTSSRSAAKSTTEKDVSEGIVSVQVGLTAILRVFMITVSLPPFGIKCRKRWVASVNVNVLNVNPATMGVSVKAAEFDLKSKMLVILPILSLVVGDLENAASTSYSELFNSQCKH